MSPELPSAPDLNNLAERTVAAVAARRCVWTVWNLRAGPDLVLGT
jgi:hypothetical protein